MKSRAYVRRVLPLAGVATRFVFVSFLVFFTFNPSYYSVSTWILSDFSLLSVKAVITFGMGMLWLILLRIAFAGLGGLGTAYLGLAGVVLVLFELRFSFLRLFSPYALVLICELALAGVITFGLVLSYWVRQASGQSAVVKSPP